MSTPVVMPQMGESIAEGTIVRWIKKVGDQVDRDEPLFEISTDKVDAEIPSPAAGVLTEIKVHEGETVAVNSVVGTIGEAGEAVRAAAPAVAAPKPPQAGSERTRPTLVDGASGSAPLKSRPNGREAAAEPTDDDLRRQKSSPLVRRIARDNNVDIGQIAGSGIGGRVTKDDILGYLGKKEEPPEPAARRLEPSGRVEIQPLSVMRRKIAEHMVLSRRTSAHVHSVFHVSFSTVEKIRQQKKGEYEQLGAKLTYMSFIAKVTVDAIRRHPIINASLDGDNIVYKKDVNLGIAVALESGLIVPVIKNADEKNLLGLSRAIADVADRARAKQLKPDEVHGGTFTITNPGQFGAQFGMPIINQPQVAILGVGTIEKRPVVVEDAIAIRTMAYLTLGYDHRLVDGAVADQFMSDIKKGIENFDPRTGVVRPLEVRRLGVVPYGEALAMQRALVEERRADRIPDLLLLLQHPPVITLGVKSDGGRSNIVATHERLTELGIAVSETGRGGDVTYHGPGQIVGYPILDLRPDRCDVHRYVRDIEEMMIRVCAGYGVHADRIPGLTGAWVGREKIGAIGVRISRWITSHGFAFNVNTNLDHFNLIVPCGISDGGVTSLEKTLGKPASVAEVEDTLVSHFCDVLGRAVAETVRQGA